MFYADRVGLARSTTASRAPSRAWRALGAGAAARALARERRHVPGARSRAAGRARPCRSDSPARRTRASCRPTRRRPRADGTSTRARRTRSARIRADHRAARTLGRDAPDRTFLAAARRRRRVAAVSPTRDALRAYARDRAGAARSRPLGRSADRHPFGQQHRARAPALGAMYVGVPYAPIAPAYSLLARDYTHAARALCERCGPGSSSRARERRFERALDAIVRRRRRDRHAARRPSDCAATPLRRAAGARAGDRRGRRRARARRTATPSPRCSSRRDRPGGRRA